MKTHLRIRAITAAAGVLFSAHAACAAYTSTVLVANDASYHPTVMVDPLLQNAWGIALRPPGAGGHFWISNFATGTTTTYVGDAHGVPLHQDSLQSVNIARGTGVRVDGRPTAEVPQPTGQVYNTSTTDFMISGEGITGPSKFIFVTGEGTISGWTEVPDPAHPGQTIRQTTSVLKVDQSPEYDDDRLRYTGVAVTDYAQNNRLYATNYITQEVEVYDKNFQRVTLPAERFRIPGMPADYHAWNAQYAHTGPNGAGRLWVAYAVGGDPWEQDNAQGAVGEFDLDGHFIRRLSIATDADPFADSELKAPWGMAFAPHDFGALSEALLIANFGDGTIAGYDVVTGQFIDYVRDTAGAPIAIDGLWGLTFGNGVSLGDANALYFTAGPNGERDGLLGSIRVAVAPEPTALGVISVAALLRRRRRAVR